MKLRDYQAEAVLEGYPFECGCGEQFRTARAAWECRKCRVYLTENDFDTRTVIDLSTGENVSRHRVFHGND